MARVIQDGVESIDQLGARTVVESDGEAHARVGLGLTHGALDIAAHFDGQLIGPTDYQQADVVLVDDGQLLAEVFAEQPHQEIDLGFGPTPVLE